MERLTKRLDCGRVAIFSTEDGEEYIPQAVLFREAVDRLAAYEDHGLTPERVAELAQAERAGRLVVLPDGGDTAALAATIDSTDMIRVWCGGDSDLLIGLLSMLSSEVAKKAGTTYSALLMAMMTKPPIGDGFKEKRTEEGKSDEKG